MFDELPATAIASVNHVVADLAEEAATDAVLEHEQRMHIPPPRRGKVTAIPYPNVQMNDSQVCGAWEMLKEGATLQEAALAFGVPDLALERCLREYQPAYRAFLDEREAGV